MELLYENEVGTLRLNGGSGLWNIIEISGLGLPEKSFQVVRYAMTAGQVTLDAQESARLITLRGDCCTAREAVAEGIRILNRQGRLTLLMGGAVRCLDAYCSHFEIEQPRHGLRSFVIQLTADEPFFEGEEPLMQALYSREKLVNSSFVLPCVFTKRTSDTVVCNRGDVVSEPIFTVMCRQAGEQQETEGFYICNKTTGHTLTVRYNLSQDEVVSIDIAGRRITSSLQSEDNYNGNLIYFIDEDSFLHDMYMAVGDNHIISGNYSGADLLINCELREKYVEAVM